MQHLWEQLTGLGVGVSMLDGVGDFTSCFAETEARLVMTGVRET